MVAGHEGRGEWPGIQEVQACVISAVAVPHAAEVPVIPNSGQRRLYRKKYYPEIFYIALKMQ